MKTITGMGGWSRYGALRRPPPFPHRSDAGPPPVPRRSSDRSPTRPPARVAHLTPWDLGPTVRDRPLVAHTRGTPVIRRMRGVRHVSNETTQQGAEQDEAVYTSVSNPRRVRL